MKHIIYKGIIIYSGDSITGSIEEIPVEGRLSIDNMNLDDQDGCSTRAFFCQDKKDGAFPADRKGYPYGWVFSIRDGHSLINDVIINSYRGVLIDDSTSLINSKEKTMDDSKTLQEKFALLLTTEPQKSFRKLGITDGNDLLTTEGTRIFLSWLLKEKFAEDFKKDVVDRMIKADEKNSKK